MSIIRSIVVVLILMLSSQALRAQQAQGSMALGIRLSTPQATVNNAVSFRYFIRDQSALEALVGFDPWSVGLLYEKFLPTRVPGLEWYFGGGAYGAFTGSDVLGAMGIIGLDYTLPSVPINMSVDWKPELNLVNNVHFQGSALALSVRFVF